MLKCKMSSSPYGPFLKISFQIMEEMELENLAKMYLADLIKKECWDNMVVKGRGIGVSWNTSYIHKLM